MVFSDPNPIEFGNNRVAYADENPHLQAALNYILDVTGVVDRAVTVGITARAGAGKSTLAYNLGKRLPDASVMSIDDYLPPEFADARDETGWGNYEWSRFKNEIMDPLARGNRQVRYQRRNWETGALGEERVLRAGRFVIIEGVGLFRPGLQFDRKILLTPSKGESVERGVERMGEESRSRWKTWELNDDDYFTSPQFAGELATAHIFPGVSLNEHGMPAE